MLQSSSPSHPESRRQIAFTRAPDRELEVTISDLSRAGAGVAKDPEGRVLFVPLTAPGDRVRVKIGREQKNYAQAELVEVLEPSALRQTPKCPVFGRCGGCQWQHLPYDLQWKTKLGGVRHALSRVKVDLPGEMESLPAERIWEYRNRIQLRGNANEMGFYARGSNDLVPVSRCEIARPELNAILPETFEEGRGLPRSYKVEIEVLPAGEVRKAWNSPHAAMGFRQVHDEQNEKLRSWVAGAVSPGRELFDLYGGSGNLSLGLASRMSRVYCVDVSAPEASPTGTPSNLGFHRGPVKPWLVRRARNESRAGFSPVARSAILDPPRDGLDSDFADIALALESLGIDEIVAVGCDADNWAGDLARFQKRGWRLERAAALDLFPQTPHVEALGLLRR